MAERPLSWPERRRHIRRRWLVPVHRLEWAFEWLNYGISRWAFVAFLDQLARFSVLVAVIYWIATASDRTQERHYQAWQTISAAAGKSGDLGRRMALRDLAKSDVSLMGVDLSHAYFLELSLPRSDLAWVRLDSATCLDCDLRAAMSLGRFRHAWLDRTDFRRASANQADFRHAQVVDATFDEAWLDVSRFVGASIRRSSFRGAILADALLDSANVAGADFSGADFRGASLVGLRNWREIRSMQGANLYEVLDPPDGFLAWATDTMGAVMSPSITEWMQSAPDARSEEMWQELIEHDPATVFAPGASRRWWARVDAEDRASGGEGRW